MEFDWKEYFELAKHLRSLSTNEFRNEAALRSAISRAYYAAYCHVRNYAINQLSFKASGYGKDHAELRRHIQKTRISWATKFLARLLQYRETADYDNIIKSDEQTSMTLEEMTDLSIETTEKIFNTIKNTTSKDK